MSGELTGAAAARSSGQAGDLEITVFAKQSRQFWRVSVSEGSKQAGRDF